MVPDARAAVATLSDDVTLRVAVYDEPFHGKPAAEFILEAVLDGVLHDVEIVETVVADGMQLLLFRTDVAGHQKRADGLVLARPGATGFTDVTVFLRPLVALQALSDEMGQRLGQPHPDGVA